MLLNHSFWTLGYRKNKKDNVNEAAKKTQPSVNASRRATR